MIVHQPNNRLFLDYSKKIKDKQFFKKGINILRNFKKYVITNGFGLNL